MHPVLFKLPLPGFLENLIGPFLTIHSYGFLIVVGAISGIIYLYRVSSKKYNTSFDTINSLFLLLLAAAFIGGKFFLIFEDPQRYVNHPMQLLSGQGFVFYGSLLFCIPTMLFFFKKHGLPIWPMLDIMAIVTCIVHFFGRLGCFMAGCCYGIESHGPLAVIFHDPASIAPTEVPLHPTQLYSAVMILIILATLLKIKNREQFPGQVFLIYLIMYAAGRSVVEIYRGDEARGYVIDGILSHSQFISLIILGVTVYFYHRLHHKYRLQKKTV